MDKRKVFRLALTFVLLVLCCFLPIDGLWRLSAFAFLYVFCGYKIILESVENVLQGHIFDENFLMLLAGIGAFIIGEYPEAIFVMLFFQVGELFENSAEEKSRSAIVNLMDVKPDHANLLRGADTEKVSPSDVKVGDVILVRPGEKIPLDGVVLAGESFLDTSALTGESILREVSPGSEVFSGCINQSGVLQIRVQKTFGESTVSKILELVERSAQNKSKSEAFITKFARIYTPVVVCLAFAIAIIPSIFLGNWTSWLHRAIVMLVISCPCALVVSVPLSYFLGIGCAASNGILVKGSNYLESLTEIKMAVFDKTGTLTKGRFEVSAVRAINCTEEKLLSLAAAMEQNSTHPIAVCIREKGGTAETLEDVRELAGYGICANQNGNRLLLGNRALLEKHQINIPPIESGSTTLYLSQNDELLGVIVLSDTIKSDSLQIVDTLHRLGVKKCVMLTGDRNDVGKEIAKKLKMDEAYCELLPNEKVLKFKELKAQSEAVTAFVGDGINDAPVLAEADVAVAMGALGSDAAIEAADVVLMDDKPSKLPLAIQIAKRTKRIAIENISLSLTVKAVIMLLLNLVPLSLAVFADVGVLILAILNSMRALKWNCKSKKT